VSKITKADKLLKQAAKKLAAEDIKVDYSYSPGSLQKIVDDIDHASWQFRFAKDQALRENASQRVIELVGEVEALNAKLFGKLLVIKQYLRGERHPDTGEIKVRPLRNT